MQMCDTGNFASLIKLIQADHIFRIVIGNIHQISELTFSCFLVCYQTGHLNIYTLSLFYSDKINFLLFMLPYINVILQI